MKGKKAQTVLYIFFIIAALIIVVLAAVLAPMGVLFTSKMYEAGEDILDDSMPTINLIEDESVKLAINGTVQAAKDATVTNIEVNSAFFQYGWIVVIMIGGIIVFLQARRLIEVGAGGFI